MALTPGTRLGPYEIVAAIGAGGMGEVYRATDSNLKRSVAIKVLPASVAVDADRLARFQREAEVLAALNHPNIAAIYGLERAPDVTALVMELVEGEDLSAHIARGPIGFADALPIARQIADSLEAAHEQGIVHRDLKPANIKVRADGTVKVLDFGLAKAIDPSGPSGADVMNSPTLTARATQMGMILGTAAYMAPEQAKGKSVDKRADIWAFGVVLHEMLTGRRLFEAEDISETLAAVLTREVSLTSLPTGTPPRLRALVRDCLIRDPKQRLRDIGDARLVLDKIIAGAPDDAVAPATTTAAKGSAWRRVLPWAIVPLVAVAAVSLALRPPVQDVWTGVRLGGPAQAFGVRLSPDGQLLAFLAMVDRVPQVAVMKPDAGSWTVLTHERHGYVATVSWAPDGSRIYFDRVWGHPLGVYSIPPLGGEPRPLLDDAFGPEPLPDGSLVVLKLTDQGDEQVFHFWPDSGRLDALPVFMPQNDVAPRLRAFPDGLEIVFYGMSEAGRSRGPHMLIYNLTSRTTRELSSDVHVGVHSTWAPLDVSADGESVYLLSEAGDTQLLLDVPRRRGRPHVLLTFPATAAPVSLDAARDGSLYLDQRIYSPTIMRAPLAGGASEEFFVPPGNRNMLAVPGGEVLMNTSTAGRPQIGAARPGGELRLPVNTTEESTLPATILGGNLAFAVGSGDAKRLAIASLKDGRILRRYSGRSDGGLSASPDGQTLYYSSAGAIWAQPVAGGEPARVTDGEDVVPDPSGQYLYVRRAHRGANEIVRIPLRGGEAVVLPVPPDYHIAIQPLSPAAVDARGRILVTVASQESFYYQTALLDPATKSFTLIPVAVEGDAFSAGWTADGRIVAAGERYPLSLWRYHRAK